MNEAMMARAIMALHVADWLLTVERDRIDGKLDSHEMWDQVQQCCNWYRIVLKATGDHDQ